MSKPSRYMKMASKIWRDEKFYDLSPEAKLLYIYILSSPHSNMAGFYVLPELYIMDDLKMDRETVSEGFGELFEKGLVNRCSKSSVTLVPNYLKYNQVANPNQAIGINQRVKELPANALVGKFKEACKAHCSKYYETVTKGLPQPLDKEFIEGLDKGFGEPDTDTDTDTDTETPRAREENKSDDLPYEEIVEHLNEKAVKNFNHTSANTRKLIRGRFKDGYELEDFKEVIDKKCADWLGNNEMEKFLRPDTLFRPTNFENYIQEPWPEKKSGGNGQLPTHKLPKSTDEMTWEEYREEFMPSQNTYHLIFPGKSYEEIEDLIRRKWEEIQEEKTG